MAQPRFGTQGGSKRRRNADRPPVQPPLGTCEVPAAGCGSSRRVRFQPPGAVPAAGCGSSRRVRFQPPGAVPAAGWVPAAGAVPAARCGAAVSPGPRVTHPGSRRRCGGRRAPDRSPGSRPSQAARMTRRMTLPERVLGRRRDDGHALRLERLAELLGDGRGRRRPAGRRRRRPPGRSTHSTTIASPLTSWGTPMAAASRTAGWVTAALSTSAGPTRLPATLSVSSERPWMYQKPSASIDAQSPWTQMPGQRRPVGLLVALGVAPEAAGHARHRGSDDELADRGPGRARPASSTTSAAVPRHGPENAAGLSGPIDVAPDDAARDLGPAAVVDDRAATLADLAEVPPPRIGVPRLPGRAEDAQRGAVVRRGRAPRRGPSAPG